MIELKPIERRVLAYLDQRGGRAQRSEVVAMLSRPDSRHGRNILNGSNSAEPLIMGAWCKRLIAERLVEIVTHRGGFYLAHQITTAGRAYLRNPPDPRINAKQESEP